MRGTPSCARHWQSSATSQALRPALFVCNVGGSSSNGSSEARSWSSCADALRAAGDTIMCGDWHMESCHDGVERRFIFTQVDDMFVAAKRATQARTLTGYGSGTLERASHLQTSSSVTTRQGRLV
jgi:hypothetical protein